MATSSIAASLRNLQTHNLPNLASLKLPWSWSWTTVAIPSFLIYTLLCRVLRMQRRNAMHRKFGYATRESLAKMSNVDAQEIMTYLGQLEFPRIFLASLQFALFKVCYLRVVACDESDMHIRLTVSPRYVSRSTIDHKIKTDTWH